LIGAGSQAANDLVLPILFHDLCKDWVGILKVLGRLAARFRRAKIQPELGQCQMNCKVKGLNRNKW
jgi:hypothetical protein